MSNRHGLEIRAASPADAPGVSGLLLAAGQTVAAADIATRLEGVRRSGAALVAVEWGPPSGLIVLHWHQTLLDAGLHAQISLLLVGPDDRRRGLGRLLLKAAARSARAAGCDTIDVQAVEGDETMPAFCLATGFGQSGASYLRSLRKA